MSEQVQDRPELVLFRQQDAAIASMAEQYMPLTVKGLDDKAGLKAVHDARMDVKGRRVAVEKKRKELKADALAYGQAVDAEARRLTKMLEPIEEHLEHEEGIIQREKDRLAALAEEAKRAALQKRLDVLRDCGAMLDPVKVQAMTDTEFAGVLAFEQMQAAERKEAAEEAKRVAAEQAAERDRLAAIRREQEAEAARLLTERNALERAQAKRERQAQLEQAKAEAAEKARIDTEARLAREAAEKAEAERLASEQAAREEAARPYREKLLALAASVDALANPDGPFERDVAGILRHASASIRITADRKLP